MTQLDYLALVQGIAGDEPDPVGMGVVADALEEQGDDLAAAWRVLASAVRWPWPSEVWKDWIWWMAPSIRQPPLDRFDVPCRLWRDVWEWLPHQQTAVNFRTFPSCSAALLAAAEAARKALAAGWRP